MFLNFTPGLLFLQEVKTKQNKTENKIPFFSYSVYRRKKILANLAIVVDVLLLDLLTNTVPLK